MIIVSDTTPLMTLLKCDHLDLLKKMYGSVLIPSAVYNELTDNPHYEQEAKIIKDCDFLEVKEITNKERIRTLQNSTGLDLGETEALVLAEITNADLLLMDEVMGRMIAKEMGFTIAGAIGILIAAKTEGFLSADEIKITVSKLRSSGQHIGESLLKKLLESN
ncbi:MAG: DUF3368 domain-containing protein [Treponema sp.]|nr:DUF3368 domain-containing protein [Treponema sp.]